MTTTINYQRFAGIPHGDMCTWAAWVADLEETTPETEADEPRCDCGLGRVIDEYAELVAALETTTERLAAMHETYERNANRKCGGCRVEHQIESNRALLARIKGESNE